MTSNPIGTKVWPMNYDDDDDSETDDGDDNDYINDDDDDDDDDDVYSKNVFCRIIIIPIRLTEGV